MFGKTVVWIFRIAGKCRITFPSFMCKTNFTTINQVNDCRDREVYKTFCCSCCCCCSAFNHCSFWRRWKFIEYLSWINYFSCRITARYDIFSWWKYIIFNKFINSKLVETSYTKFPTVTLDSIWKSTYPFY